MTKVKRVSISLDDLMKTANAVSINVNEIKNNNYSLKASDYTSKPVKQLGDMIDDAKDKTVKRKVYQVFSPDGIEMYNNDGYGSFQAAVAAYDEWSKRYYDQGYYAAVGGCIQLDSLDQYCLVKEWINGKWFNWGSVRVVINKLSKL
jgi:hypothetical protein